jgi:hypothetical protein
MPLAFDAAKVQHFLFAPTLFGKIFSFFRQNLAKALQHRPLHEKSQQICWLFPLGFSFLLTAA